MVHLEVGAVREFALGAVAVPVQRRLPRAAIPGPVDALGREHVADVLVLLRRQRVRAGRVGAGRVVRILGEGRGVGRADGVHRPEVGGQRGATLKLRLAVHRTGWRIVGELEPGVVGPAALGDGDVVLRRAGVGVRIERRLRGDEILVVEERTAEGAHEEVVAQRELLGQAPQAQVHRAVAVVAHDQRAGVAPGDEAVVAPAVDLHLVLVERVDQVARHHALRQRFAVRRVQGKRRVRQAGEILFLDVVTAMVDHLCMRYQTVPDRRQGLERFAVTVQLHGALRRQCFQRFGQAGKAGKQVVEAAVLRVQHHHVVDVFAQQRVHRGVVDGRVAAMLARGHRRTCRLATQRQAGTGHGQPAEQAPPLRVARGVGVGGGRIVVRRLFAGHGGSVGSGMGRPEHTHAVRFDPCAIRPRRRATIHPVRCRKGSIP